MPETAPFGSWKSPVTSELIASGVVSLGQIVLEGDAVYWTEQRPQEGGRSVIVRRDRDGRLSDVTPVPFNVRTRVHEYGGGAYTVADAVVYFCNFSDQRIYRQVDGKAPEPITAARDVRFADLVFDRSRKRLVCVREDHTGADVVNSVVAIDLKGGAETILCEGSDFYASPRLSPDGSELAWLLWNHPNMPWDGCELTLARVDSAGLLSKRTIVAGGRRESIFQPDWSPEGVLHFVSDRTGWWNLYRWLDETVEPLAPVHAEFGGAQWIFGLSTYAFESERRIVASYSRDGISDLGLLDTDTLKFEPLKTPYTDISFVRAQKGAAIFNAVSSSEMSEIVRLDLTDRKITILKKASEVKLPFSSVPTAIEFPAENGESVHAFFYPARNPDFRGPPEELPPLIVISHGGPTSCTTTAFNLRIQYWTSRGFAVLDVNYGGSTGYGREYRQRLNGQWGVVDVNDCVRGAMHLVQAGEVDKNKLIIRGQSAGGYTTLCALTFRDVFRAGASYYGVSDLEALDQDTHKFESHYNATLIGPYPEKRDVYVARSPIHFPERLRCPVIFLQGLEDKVVPPNQAETMFNAVREKGLPCAYIAFEGEQHGFRRAENIKRALEAELYFYSKVFGFPLADPVEPVKIENV
ncbi:MAG: prolyl oligopeptidase family serine peptidase [Burkholderiales bacterium]